MKFTLAQFRSQLQLKDRLFILGHQRFSLMKHIQALILDQLESIIEVMELLASTSLSNMFWIRVLLKTMLLRFLRLMIAH